MLACLCCKKGDIGFKEFENAEGDDYVTELSAQGSPAPQHGPEVYVLPLTKVSLPMAKQPGRSVQLLKSADLGRQSLLYLKEIGHGWFGKVFLGEVNSGISSTQVVVKELKASASVQDQMQFLEEAQPYRALQHTNLLQCLAQCAEVTPYLLVMEFCPLGDLKGYLRSCRGAEAMTPDLLTLQRMACEVACGVLHLHRNNYIHSDLALRNCLLTADLTVKIGDYGLSHCKYKDDYFVTADQLWVPLRWIAPELIDEVHGNLLVVDQTKASNVWSLGVTIWELFELGSQPYDHYSDRQVLAYAIKEQQLKLPKPQLKLSLSERWYEVMQFCWLQPEQRPTAEEVHLLLSYLCAKGATEAEEDFEKRWNSMKPNGSASGSHHGPELSSFPLLEQFSADGFPSDGDDILTVMETSHGLNFEYKWEHTKTEHFQAPLGSLSPSSAARYHDLYYPATTAGLSLGVSPSCYECKASGCPGVPAPGVVPILGAHSPSLGSEYYIRIEGPGEGSAELDYAMCSYSPAGERGALRAPACWRAQGGRGGGNYDSDGSPTVSLSMEPLLGHAPAAEGSWECAEYYPYPCPGQEPRDYAVDYEPSPSRGAEGYLLQEEPPQPGSQDWPVPAFQPGVFADPLGVSPSGNCAYSPAGYGGTAGPSGGAPPDCVAPGADGAQPAPENSEAPAEPGADSGAGAAGDAERTPDKTFSSSSFPSVDEGSDEDTAELTSGVFTDFSGEYAERAEAAPALRSLQKQVGTPDSLESLDIPSTGSSCEVLSPGAFAPAGQARALDSGYDTENNESPEFVLKEPHEPREPEAFGQLAKPPPGLPGGEGEAAAPETRLPGAELPGLAEKSPYRDSAYFSDCDAEAERGHKDEGDSDGSRTPEAEEGPRSPAQDMGRGEDPLHPPGAPGSPPAAPGVAAAVALEGNWVGTEAGSSPEQAPGTEQSPAGTGLVPGSPPRPDTDTCPPGSVTPKTFLLTPVPVSPGEPSAVGGTCVPEGVPGLGGAAVGDKQTVTPAPGDLGLPPEGTGAGDAPGGPSTLLPAGESPPGLSPPPAAPERREEPEEEEEDTEDSDESDEELRCYNIQEQSEESEEEPAAVPIVVAESQSGRNLRSLLKMPSLLSESFCEDLERKKKAVSFYDDVTIYLFDQESPTRELAEQSFPEPTLPSGQPPSPSGQPRGGFEWDDDFPLVPVKPSLVASLPGTPAEPPAAVPALVPAQKQVLPIQFSRFTVSPAPVSRFSITHVSDSDMDSIGGSSEDGDRE
ncbi:PREDICTED: LOW QUALITY PROTEIN: serine/threonine-protein kinase LMTK1 [Ficedula albicollis]|uniref:LOW QUALITY PROTEIN: serine/threonine-protein kinase LMTK1 n=1 Tax=Ficedula albicollis TaxID=59894 RepID=UPI0007AD7CBA|nr:PREDICTED: LOW QUALITY PROTEIN: serine/threonine-protein kinase LMTK1 [Ficedula albicollis]